MVTERTLHKHQRHTLPPAEEPTIRCGAHKRLAAEVIVSGPAKKETLRQLFDRTVTEATRIYLAEKDPEKKKLVLMKGTDGENIPALADDHARHEIAENLVSEALAYPGWREPLLEMAKELRSRGPLLSELGEVIIFHALQVDASRD